MSTARPWYLSATPLGTLSWLIRLRWTTAGLETLVLLVAWLFPNADFPLHHLTPLIALSAVANVLVGVWLWRRRALPKVAACLSLALEVLLLTGLLDLTGGPYNPFTVLFAVHVALAIVTAGGLAGWSIGALAAASFGALLYWHTRELPPGHHRLNDFPTHLFTMWVAIAATAELVAYFVVQASNALARREAELDAMRVRAARSEQLIGLTTLAAGAAHELSTPLATIALASRELERAAATSSGTNAPSLVDDARLIRAEVDRCRDILDQMSGRAGGIAADDLVERISRSESMTAIASRTPSAVPTEQPTLHFGAYGPREHVDVGSTLEELVSRLPGERAARVKIEVARELPPLHVPRAAFAQVMLSLINNAFDASPDGEPVAVTAARSDHTPEVLRLVIADRGTRIAPEVLRRAGEPFYTTKEPGRGLGLGLFLARVFAERRGGSFALESDEGTRAILELPLRAEGIESALAS